MLHLHRPSFGGCNENCRTAAAGHRASAIVPGSAGSTVEVTVGLGAGLHELFPVASHDAPGRGAEIVHRLFVTFTALQLVPSTDRLIATCACLCTTHVILRTANWRLGRFGLI